MHGDSCYSHKTSVIYDFTYICYVYIILLCPGFCSGICIYSYNYSTSVSITACIEIIDSNQQREGTHAQYEKLKQVSYFSMYMYNYVYSYSII